MSSLVFGCPPPTGTRNFASLYIYVLTVQTRKAEVSVIIRAAGDDMTPLAKTVRISMSLSETICIRSVRLTRFPDVIFRTWIKATEALQEPIGELIIA